jgi:hypothetical protein
MMRPFLEDLQPTLPATVAGALALVVLVAVSLRASEPAAGYGPGSVAGIVTQKFTGGHDGGEYEVAVNGAPYEVPMTVWLSVQVGDVVRYTGIEWQIVKKFGRS